MSEPPISGRYPQIHTRDFDEARNALQNLYGDVRPDVAGDFEWRARIADLGPVLVIRSACTAAVHLDIAPKAHVLSLPVRNAARVRAPGGSTTIARGRSAGVLSPGERSAWWTETEIESVAVRIDPLLLEAHLEGLTGEPAGGPVVFAPALRTDSGPGAPVERLSHFLAEEIDRGTPLDHPVLLTTVRETLARALLLGQPHSFTHLLDRPAPPAGRMIVRRVEEYIDAHASEPIGVADLTTIAGAGARSIDAAFREHRGTTPAAFLRACRLERARKLILAEPHLSAAHVVHASGFLGIEAFEAAYFRAFQERPEDTRRRAQPTPALPRPPSSEEAFTARFASLSAREREVCEGVARGMLNKQIAVELGIAERTVREHRSRGMKKLGVESAAELGRMLARALPP